MNKKHFLKSTFIILTALALTVYNSKIPTIQAQTTNSTWELSVTGLVQNPLNLNISNLQAMPQTTEFAIEYDCDTPTSPLQQGDWTGVQLSYILSQAIVSPGAIKVAMSSSEGYYIALPVDTATADNTIILAYQFQGAALAVPVLVIPSKSGDNWIFGPTQIVLVNHNFVGNYQLEGEGFGPTGIYTSVAPVTTTPSSSQTPSPTLTSTTSPTQTSKLTASNPKPQPQLKSTFFEYIATLSVIGVLAIASTIILTKRKKTKA